MAGAAGREAPQVTSAKARVARSPPQDRSARTGPRLADAVADPVSAKDFRLCCAVAGEVIVATEVWASVTPRAPSSNSADKRWHACREIVSAYFASTRRILSRILNTGGTPMRRVLLVTLLTSVVTMFIGSPFAFAAASAPLAPGSSGAASSTSPITGSQVAVTGGIQRNSLISGISGCYGQTDQPHPSSHVNGTVNVVARTVCPAPDYVAVDQYRSRWYGWQGWGSGSNSAYGNASANAAGGCGSGNTYTYLAESYHEATGVGYAYTSNSRRFTCP